MQKKAQSIKPNYLEEKTDEILDTVEFRLQELEE